MYMCKFCTSSALYALYRGLQTPFRAPHADSLHIGSLYRLYMQAPWKLSCASTSALYRLYVLYVGAPSLYRLHKGSVYALCWLFRVGPQRAPSCRNHL